MEQRDEQDAEPSVERRHPHRNLRQREGETVEFGHLAVALREDALGERDERVGALGIVREAVKELRDVGGFLLNLLARRRNLLHVDGDVVVDLPTFLLRRGCGDVLGDARARLAKRLGELALRLGRLG